jgi:Rrf2 family transcriptional regulator, nitric oxide-sensitive transcriptional repressor
MFSQTAEYALRAVVWLGSRPDGSVTSQEIADAAQIPPRYASKVLQALGRAGLVRSQRGLHGGFWLARPAEELSILDVIATVEPIRRTAHVSGNGDSDDANKSLDHLNSKLNEAVDMVEGLLAQTKIADLIDLHASR